ncbi:MAG: S-methyl-5'-thioadenosine phosphorylase [Lentisphaeria bacterium]|nr:S-methyl-5'-thioadenosine phosphorylase [Lentisphaeria bacterium]NQZ69214.1 S-methyl-5'-thioadenosine phosphorylase [Lentisphaeria bacterium]
MKVAIIGGSGLYEIDGLEEISEETCSTPFGQPSDSIITGKIGGTEVLFLARHARGHKILPGELNHKANIYALKELGAEIIISISAVGSFKDELKPGDIVLVDQFVDRTKRGLDHTFFGEGITGHISFAQPTCLNLKAIIYQAAQTVLTVSNANNVSLHDGGTYINMEGPAFSTRAESQLYKSWGMDVIGMTNLAEAKLAREAEICYQTVAMVTDYDCWHPNHEAVTVEMVIQTLMQNASLAKDLIIETIKCLENQNSCTVCPTALQVAIVTSADIVPDEIKNKLKPIIGKYIS